MIRRARQRQAGSCRRPEWIGTPEEKEGRKFFFLLWPAKLEQSAKATCLSLLVGSWGYYNDNDNDNESDNNNNNNNRLAVCYLCAPPAYYYYSQTILAN